MICVNCRTEVENASVCPVCGMNLAIFQKVRRISNSYYNDGLEKASVRNLSGAIISLKKSLKFNKYNIDARNLLGLVYYEIGETVAALSEWVISQSYQPKENRANYYLEQIQQNSAHLNSVNQTIKKYNQALLYCKQDSRDLAIIQLKKVLSLNPKLVKGHQLLALLYIQEGKLELAKKTLRTAAKIDTDNTMTMRYLKEVNMRLRENAGSKKVVKQADDLISYQSGNETIIMPKRIKESSLGGSIAYVLIGLAVGIAATAFLIVPNVRRSAKSEANKQLLEANDMITTYTQTIDDLQREIDGMQADIDAAKVDSQSGQAAADSYDNLLNAYVAYNSNDILTVGKCLTDVDPGVLSESAAEIYNTMNEQVSEQYLSAMYNAGYEAYNTGDYDTAIENLLAVVEEDEAYKDGSAAYYLAQAYRRNDDLDSAQQYYRYIVENYPGTERATTAENYLD
ncbi:MAG: tetratricopeptide repeat protein [Lachnospiraceae bacterium]|nr:tetratricopeptide repeat protein [Lachnospiraceae bacterium]MDD6503909.1 tetratricopeptide repeat protein [Lachnospiraceae bacterium]